MRKRKQTAAERAVVEAGKATTADIEQRLADAQQQVRDLLGRLNAAEKHVATLTEMLERTNADRARAGAEDDANRMRRKLRELVRGVRDMEKARAIVGAACSEVDDAAAAPAKMEYLR